MSFVVENEVELEHSVEEVYKKLDSSFFEIVKLSPTTFSIDVTQRDHCWMKEDLSYTEESTPDSFECSRLYFKLVERVKIMKLFNKDVEIFGTQISFPHANKFLYESVANGGLVKIRKRRELHSLGQNKTLVKERIDGKVSNVLIKGMTRKEANVAHKKNMDGYSSLWNSQEEKEENEDFEDTD